MIARMGEVTVGWRLSQEWARCDDGTENGRGDSTVAYRGRDRGLMAAKEVLENVLALKLATFGCLHKFSNMGLH